MKTSIRPTAAAVVLTIVAVTPVRAQEQSAQSGASAQSSATAEPARNRALASIVPLKLTVVLSRYRGEKKVASESYELSVRTDGNKASVRMSTPAVLVPNVSVAGAQPAPGSTLFTNIDCSATNLDNGRFAVTVTIEDSSIYEDSRYPANGSKTDKSLRMFRTTNALVLRDGQMTEFTAATDKINGEVIKAAVTLAVMK